jgi:hypothetical protein
MNDATSKKLMLGSAKDYERIAARAEERRKRAKEDSTS